MKKLIFFMGVFSVNLANAIPVEVITDIPAHTQEIMSRFDAATTLQSMIAAVSKAQTTVEQVKALKNLENLQKNPGASIQQVNSAVNGLVSNFNTLNTSSFQNLSQLIGSLAGSTTSTGMNIKLMQASNMQLSAIQATLQNIQAQNQALVAYKQAEANEQTRQRTVNQKQIKTTTNALKSL